uniref:Uncharacterized protein n=1 Tax=Zooxanthella nutricula TaxID=1333877 RepID=A0A7S2QDX9_9DINO|mmetsp:Transcript_8717/g.25969  ORF Transcript_8717/g.25969 Transcript_8717/m.25969 type:complete len:240 (+) Transcript_8717:531-1250(+)
MHAMLGNDQMLHRASSLTSVDNFTELTTGNRLSFACLSNEYACGDMPDLLKNAPYYTDGRLIYDALRTLVTDFFDLYSNDLCGRASGAVTDRDLKRFAEKMSYPLECNQLADSLTEAIFTVTAWHHHVSAMGDYFSDPDLATMAWMEDERFGQPERHVILSMAVALASAPHPKLDDDFAHVFAGIKDQERAESIWQEFRRDLSRAEEETRQDTIEIEGKTSIKGLGGLLPSRVGISASA